MTAAAWSEGASNEELAGIFHKCTSHSEFLTIMLGDKRLKGIFFCLLIICLTLII